MDDFRSKAWEDPRVRADTDYYHRYSGNTFNGVAQNHGPSSNPSGMQDLRCYSASYAAPSSIQNKGRMDDIIGGGGEPWKFKKGKSTNEVSSKNWNFGDPELQRKKRVVSYKAYAVEGKFKGSIKKSIRWLKERCNHMIYGYR